MFPQVSPSLLALDFASLTHHRVLCALCFHGLTNCFCRNSFRFTSIQIAGGCGGEAGKTVGRVCTMDTNKRAFINLQTLVVPKKSNAFVFSQIQTRWAKRRSGVSARVADVPNLAPSQASKSVHSLASCRLHGWVP